MAELELDMNQRVWEWSALQESDSQLQPLHGPGLTGIHNLGNSCYMNAVMQVIMTMPQFAAKLVAVVHVSVIVITTIINKAIELMR